MKKAGTKEVERRLLSELNRIERQTSDDGIKKSVKRIKELLEGDKNRRKAKSEESKQKPKYRKLLNKKDPIDKQILRSAKEGELKVGIVELNKYIKDIKKK